MFNLSIRLTVALLAWYDYSKMVIDTNDNETGFECIRKGHTRFPGISPMLKNISLAILVYIT